MISAFFFGFCNPTLQSQNDKPYKIQIHAHLPSHLQFLSFESSMASPHTVHEVKPRPQKSLGGLCFPTVWPRGIASHESDSNFTSKTEEGYLHTHKNSTFCAQNIFYTLSIFGFTPIHHTKTKNSHCHGN